MMNEYKAVDKKKLKKKKKDNRNERLSARHSVGSVHTGFLGRYVYGEGAESYCQLLPYKSLAFFDRK